MDRNQIASETPFAPGKVAVITGAASGIGRAAAGRFSGIGMRIVLFDKDAARLAEVAGSLAAETKTIAGDVGHPWGTVASGVPPIIGTRLPPGLCAHSGPDFQSQQLRRASRTPPISLQ